MTVQNGASREELLCAQLRQALPGFGGLTEAEAGGLLAAFRCRSVAAQADLWCSGEPGDSLAFIVSGKIELQVDTEFPGKQVVVGVFSRGAVIGTGSVLSHHPRTSTARVLEDAVVAVLDPRNLEALLQEQPQAGIKLLKGILLSESHRLSKAYARLASVF